MVLTSIGLVSGRIYQINKIFSRLTGGFFYYFKNQGIHIDKKYIMIDHNCELFKQPENVERRGGSIICTSLNQN